MSKEVRAWCDWCCRLPSSGNRGAPSPPGGDGCTFPWAPSIHAHRTTRPAAFFLCSHSRHFLATTNPGSDGKVLKALAFAVLQLWPLAAGAAYRLNQLRYWGIHPSFGFLKEPETKGGRRALESHAQGAGRLRPGLSKSRRRAPSARRNGNSMRSITGLRGQ